VALLAANGFFVAAEFALLAARRSRIEQYAADGDRRAIHALAGIRELSLMLAGAQLGITICSLLLGALAEPAIAHLIEAAISGVVELPEGVLHAIGFTIALAISFTVTIGVAHSRAIPDSHRDTIPFAVRFTDADRESITFNNALSVAICFTEPKPQRESGQVGKHRVAAPGRLW